MGKSYCFKANTISIRLRNFSTFQLFNFSTFVESRLRQPRSLAKSAVLAISSAPILAGLTALFSLTAQPSPIPENDRLVMITMQGYLPQNPLLVRLEIRKPDGTLDRGVWDAAATLTVTAGNVELATNQVMLHNGLGAGLITVSGEGDFELTAQVGALIAARSVVSLAGQTVTDVSGTLPPGTTRWNGIIHVTADTTIPANGDLIIEAGTWVLVNGVVSGIDGTDIIILGKVSAQGTEDNPINITAFDPTMPWGDIRHKAAQESVYRYTFFNRGGHSTITGHTATGPIVRLDLSQKTTFEECVISHNPGKVMVCTRSDLVLKGCFLARSAMGPEIWTSNVLAERTWFVEMFGPDDNDGLYLWPKGPDKSPDPMRFDQCVFGICDDDAIDHHFNIVDNKGVWPSTHYTDCIMRDAFDKGMSLVANVSRIERCLIVNNDKGIFLRGDNNGVLYMDRTTMVNKSIGLFVGGLDPANSDSHKVECFITNSILETTRFPHQAITFIHKPEAIHVSHSLIGETWEGAGNINGVAAVDHQNGQFSLPLDSPAIDSGDPVAEPDTDGTRADMGAMPFFQTQKAPSLSAPTLHADGRVSITLTGAARQSYAIETTSDLDNKWTWLMDVTLQNYFQEFAEPGAAGIRFYRARLLE